MSYTNINWRKVLQVMAGGKDARTLANAARVVERGKIIRLLMVKAIQWQLGWQMSNDLSIKLRFTFNCPTEHLAWY